MAYIDIDAQTLAKHGFFRVQYLSLPEAIATLSRALSNRNNPEPAVREQAFQDYKLAMLSLRSIGNADYNKDNGEAGKIYTRVLTVMTPIHNILGTMTLPAVLAVEHKFTMHHFQHTATEEQVSQLINALTMSENAATVHHPTSS